MNSQSILVPKISTLPVHEPRARAIVRWLVRKNIIEEELTTCGRTGNGMAYAIAPGAREVVLHPEALPFGALRVALLLQLAQGGRLPNAHVVKPRLYLVRFAPGFGLVAGAG